MYAPMHTVISVSSHTPKHTHMHAGIALVCVTTTKKRLYINTQELETNVDDYLLSMKP